MKKKRVKKINCFALLASLMCISFSSCGEGNMPAKYEKKDGVYINKEAKSVIMIIGNHAGCMKAPEDVYNKLDEVMDDIVYGGYFALINVDSTPTKVELEEKSFFVEDRKYDVAVQSEIEKRKSKLKNDIKEAVEIPPDSPEADLLQAIREAKSILSDVSTEKKEIIIVDTGISTAGDLNLCSINFDEDPSKRRTSESIIDEYLLNFEGRNILPDLSGIDVIFYGSHGNMAPASAPQNEKMLTTDEQYIKELWEDIVNKSGAASVSFEEIAGWDTPILESEEVPHVSPVLFKRLIPPEDPGSLGNDIVGAPKIELSLFNSEIGFNANSATLVSQDNFVSQYQQLAMQIQVYLEGNKDKKIYIAGAVAKSGNDNGYGLSHDRAEVLKDFLVNGVFKDKNGNNIYIDAGQIATIGLGDKFPDKIDEYPNGTFEESLAMHFY